MSAHVLLKLLNELGKEIKCEACRAFYRFFATSLINSIIQEHECKILFIIYHMTFKLFLNRIFGVKMLGSSHMRDIKNVIS